MNTTELKNLRFPVYKLPSEPTEVNGVRFYETLTVKSGELNYRVVDDLKIKAPTLGRRRLQLAKQSVKLFRFKTAVYYLGDMVRLTKVKDTMWIDSEGKLFKLAKSTKFNLEPKRIKQTFQKVGYVILDIEDEVQRYRSLYGPPSSKHMAVIMVHKNIRLFYGFALPDAKLTYKKV